MWRLLLVALIVGLISLLVRELREGFKKAKIFAELKKAEEEKELAELEKKLEKIKSGKVTKPKTETQNLP